MNPHQCSPAPTRSLAHAAPVPSPTEPLCLAQAAASVSKHEDGKGSSQPPPPKLRHDDPRWRVPAIKTGRQVEISLPSHLHGLEHGRQSQVDSVSHSGQTSLFPLVKLRGAAQENSGLAAKWPGHPSIAAPSRRIAANAADEEGRFPPALQRLAGVVAGRMTSFSPNANIDKGPRSWKDSAADRQVF